MQSTWSVWLWQLRSMPRWWLQESRECWRQRRPHKAPARAECIGRSLIVSTLWHIYTEDVVPVVDESTHSDRKGANVVNSGHHLTLYGGLSGDCEVVIGCYHGIKNGINFSIDGICHTFDIAEDSGRDIWRSVMHSFENRVDIGICSPRCISGEGIGISRVRVTSVNILKEKLLNSLFRLDITGSLKGLYHSWCTFWFWVQMVLKLELNEVRPVAYGDRPTKNLF